MPKAKVYFSSMRAAGFELIPDKQGAGIGLGSDAYELVTIE